MKSRNIKELIILLVFIAVASYFWSTLVLVKAYSVIYPIVFCVLFYVFLRKDQNKRQTNSLVYFFSFAFLAYVRSYYDFGYFDDTGFVIRYLRNAWDHDVWFHFNEAEPPVYGLSGFLYGLVCTFLCKNHFVLPEDAISLMANIGIFFTSVMVFRIFIRFTKSNWLALMFWLFTMCANTYYLNSVNAGLETAFHLMIVVAAFYFFFTDKYRNMWLFIGLSITSKMDAVPAMVVLGSTYFINRFLLSKQKLAFVKTWLTKELLFAIVPVGLYLIMTYSLFGSPLPHSAATKLSFHQSKDEFWFPFLSPVININAYKYLLGACLSLFVITMGCLPKLEKEKRLGSVLFGLAFLATMTLYYIYNPLEKMEWYYPLPILMLYMQGMVSIHVVASVITKNLQQIAHATLYVLIVAGVIVFLKSNYKYSQAFMLGRETQRAQIGLDLEELVHKEDTITACHGMPVATLDGFVLDMTGLNSEAATEIGLDLELAFEKYNPTWHEGHTYYNLLELLNKKKNYHLVDRYYAFTKFNSIPIDIYKRDDTPGCTHDYKTLLEDHVKGEGLEVEKLGEMNNYVGANVIFTNCNFDNARLYFGNVRFGFAYNLLIEELKGDEIIETTSVNIPTFNKNYRAEEVEAFEYQLKNRGVTAVRLRADVDWIHVHIHTPMIEYTVYK